MPGVGGGEFISCCFLFFYFLCLHRPGSARGGSVVGGRKQGRRGADWHCFFLKSWSALGMCGYGGHNALARLLLDHGADLGNLDVDGDTAESLARNRGRADLVAMFDKEGAVRDLKWREMDGDEPRPRV